MEAGLVTHEFDAFFDKDSRVLILGTIPSPKSREQGFYYGHPQNRFWKVLADVLGEEFPQTVEERKRFLKRNHIALWDVLESCEIKGASDVSIRNARPNDMNRILRAADIRAILPQVQRQRSCIKSCVFRSAEWKLFVCPLRALPTADARMRSCGRRTARFVIM